MAKKSDEAKEREPFDFQAAYRACMEGTLSHNLETNHDPAALADEAFCLAKAMQARYEAE